MSPPRKVLVVDVREDNDELADVVNKLFVVGFNLLNIGSSPSACGSTVASFVYAT